jgi:hypothetical protein
MKIFSSLPIACATSLIVVLIGFSATAKPSKEFLRPLIAQDRSPADIDRQRDAEKKLKDAERDRNFDRDRFERPTYYPSYPNNPTFYPNSNQNFRPDSNPSSNSNNGQPSGKTTGTFSLSTGFNGGTINPAIGYRLPNSNIGFEIGAVLNRDALPSGNLTEDSRGVLISGFSNGINNLGVKKITPNIGADVLIFSDVSPQVGVYGGVGIYFQGKSQIVQSKDSNDLFKSNNETNINLALSGGADLKLGNSWRIGAGYHSLRGVTAKIGYEF